MMRKLGMFLMITLLVSLIPGVALAGGGVPTGATLQSWIVGGNESHASISFYYSGGFSTDIALSSLYDPSWHKLNDVRPILEAYKEGYGPNLGGVSGIVGTDINFAPNVLAAMKVQSFNPSQVGGANIPPSSTTLNSAQTAWLQKMGYSVTATSSTATTSASTPSSQPALPQTQVNPQSSSQPTSTRSSKASTTAVTGPAVQSKSIDSSTSVSSNPAVGETVKTKSGPMTLEMVASDQKLAAENPPSLNPTDIPIKEPATKETSPKRNPWIWAAAGSGILALVGIAGRVLYLRHRAA